MPASQPRPLSGFQFRLSTLFIITLIAAVFSALVRVVPWELWFIIGFPAVVIFGVTASILGAIYRQGAWRAFWLGYGIALAQVLLFGLFSGILSGRGGWGFNREWEALLLIPTFALVVPIASGMLGVYLYRGGLAQQIRLARLAERENGEHARHETEPASRPQAEPRWTPPARSEDAAG